MQYVMQLLVACGKFGYLGGTICAGGCGCGDRDGGWTVGMVSVNGKKGWWRRLTVVGSSGGAVEKENRDRRRSTTIRVISELHDVGLIVRS